MQYWAHKFEYAHDFDDLVQEGNMGLLRAIEKFRPGKGTQFKTYAALWVKAFMGRLHARSGLIRTADKSCVVQSYDEPREGADGGETTFLAGMEDEALVPLDQQTETAQLTVAVQSALSRISQRLRGLPLDIVHERLMRNGVGDSVQLEVLGARHGVSRERVRQVEIRTRKLLAHYLEPLREAHGF